jgi:hypothetical protein
MAAFARADDVYPRPVHGVDHGLEEFGAVAGKPRDAHPKHVGVAHGQRQQEAFLLRYALPGRQRRAGVLPEVRLVPLHAR